MSFLFDFIVLIVITLFVLICMRMGFIRSLVQLLRWVVSFLISYLLSFALAPAVYDGFFRAGLEESVNNTMGDVVSGAVDGLGISDITAKIPSFLAGMLNFDPSAIEQSVSDTLQEQGIIASNSIMTTVIDPVITALIGAVLFLLLFSLLMLITKLLARSLNKINKIPVIGSVNRILGACLGLVEGMVFVLVVSFFIDIVLGFSGNIGPITQEEIGKTFLWNLFFMWR